MTAGTGRWQVSSERIEKLVIGRTAGTGSLLLGLKAGSASWDCVASSGAGSWQLTGNLKLENIVGTGSWQLGLINGLAAGTDSWYMWFGLT